MTSGLRQLGRWGCVASAVASLPPTLFSPPWLLLFCLPGVVFLLLSLPRWRRPLPFAERLTLAVLLEAAVSFAIFQSSAAPVPQAALTYLLLAPLAYATLRRRDLDVLHSLFLALCLLLIGSILRGAVPLIQVLAFAVFACSVLQSEAQDPGFVARPCALVAMGSRRARWLRRAAVATACVLAFAGLFELLQRLPSPGHSRSTGHSAARIGPSNRFNLGGGQRGPLDLVDDELVTVFAPPGGRVPDDLYLRCGYFDVAGLDRWRRAPHPRRVTHDLAARRWERRAVRGAPIEQLIVRRSTSSFGMIYLPPGTFRIDHVRGPLSLSVCNEMEDFFQPAPAAAVVYAVRYQDLRPYAEGRDAVAPTSGLTHLPRQLEQRADLARLARQWMPSHRSPTEIAAAFQAGLRARCRYALKKPRGGSPHELDNFLFGNRQGYCMHFASAMAILLRLRGVPCRIGVGLYGGRSGERPGQRVYGSGHAHSWVEIPLEGLGWVVFDPTPPASLAGDRRHWPDPALDAAGAAAASRGLADDRDTGQSLLGSLPLRLLWPWVALTALLLALSLRPRHRLEAAAPGRGTTPEGRAARRRLQRILTELARAGHPRPPTTTLERYAAALAADACLDDPRLRGAFRAYQDVRFGAKPLDHGRRTALADGLEAARRHAARRPVRDG